MQLLSILKSYDPLKYIEYSFTYESLDSNADTFYLENKGELLFTLYRSKTYYRIGGLNLNIYLSNKFISKKKFTLKCNSENTTVYDVENSNVRIYENMKDQLCNTRFRVNQIIPPLLLNDSSALYNKRFFEKIIGEKALDAKDSLLSIIELDADYLGKYYRFDISFKNFDEKKAIKKWSTSFEKQFILKLKNKRFVIVVNKQNLLPVEYSILSDSNQFETYHAINIQNKNANSPESFNPYSYDPFPRFAWYTFFETGKIINSCSHKLDQTAFDFTETDCLSPKKIRLFDIKSEYILLYVWNTQSTDNSPEFQALCKLAKDQPAKFSIIGLNNYNESKPYIEKTHLQNQWQFPTIKGKEICKKYYVSEAPAFILLHRNADTYIVAYWYIIANSKRILYYVLNN